MPELPEVETVVKGLRPQIEGRLILKCRHASDLMARCVHGTFSRLLNKTQVMRLRRHGKWMFFDLAGDQTLVIHLGMTGRLSVVSHKTQIVPHTHLRLAIDDGKEELRFSDPRRFGELILYSPANFNQRFGKGKIGPDALALKRIQLEESMQRTRRNIKSVLLDQKVVAGIGNIYADEILFDARLSPDRSANDLNVDEIQLLHRCIGKVLRRAVRNNGTTIRDYVTSSGVPGDFQSKLRVYGRADQPCKNCSTPIELIRTIVSKRATYWCPVCQGSDPGRI